jgi:hypothetical protein
MCLRWGDFSRGGRTCHAQTTVYCYCWEVIPSSNLSYTKRSLVGWMSGSSNQKGWIDLADGLCDLGGGTFWLKTSMIFEDGPCLFWIISWHLPYNWGKAQKTVRVTEYLDTCCADLAVFLGTTSAGLLSISPPRLPVGDFSQPLVGTGVLQVPEPRGSPHQLALSRKSASALMCSAKNGILKSSWICLLPTYQGALVAMQTLLGCNTCNFGTWLWAADLQIGHA